MSDESLQIVIPMAGRGQRFASAGFTEIKPLIHVDGLSMVEHIVSLFPGEKDMLFICTREHLQKTGLRKELNRVAPWGTIGAVEFNRLGPVATVLAARHLIHDEHPVLVTYCDFSLQWDFAKFAEFLKKTGCDGALPACRGFHPHTLGTNLHGCLEAQGDRVTGIRKQQASDSDFTAVGIYYFKSGALMKQYFESVLRSATNVDGEYVASLAYPLMIADGLDVRAYEVEKFLQFETPEDLRTYERWAEFFAGGTDWKPRQPQAGALLLSLAGEGSRFVDAGYTAPKPAIPAHGKPMLARATVTLPKAEKTVAILRPALRNWPGLKEALPPGTELVELTGVSEGPAQTCLAAKEKIDADAPLLIAPTDVIAVFDEKKWAALQEDPAVDFAIWTFRNDSHANRQSRQYAWVAADRQGRISRIQCGEPLRKDPSQDPASSGILWFRRAGDFFAAAAELVAAGRKVADEYWLEAVAQQLVEQGRKGRIFDLAGYVCLGTPDELLTFEYWADYFRIHHAERPRARRVG